MYLSFLTEGSQKKLARLKCVRRIDTYFKSRKQLGYPGETSSTESTPPVQVQPSAEGDKLGDVDALLDASPEDFSDFLAAKLPNSPYKYDALPNISANMVSLYVS